MGRLTFGFGTTSSGKTVTERTALQTTAVFACVKVISEAVASLPLHVYEESANGDKNRAVRHPLYNLLHLSPNKEMTAYTFIETALAHLLIYGNFYAQVIRDGRGYPAALYPLLPCNMAVDRVNGEIEYTYSTDSGQVKLTPWSVIHVPGLGFDGIIGYSPIALAKNSIGMAMATEEYGSSFFKNGANPGGVLEFPNTVKDIKRSKTLNALRKHGTPGIKAATTPTVSPFWRKARSSILSVYRQTRRSSLKPAAISWRRLHGYTVCLSTWWVTLNTRRFPILNTSHSAL